MSAGEEYSSPALRRLVWVRRELGVDRITTPAQMHQAAQLLGVELPEDAPAADAPGPNRAARRAARRRRR